MRIFTYLWSGLWYLFTVIIFLVKHYHGWVASMGMIVFLALSIYHSFCFAQNLDTHLGVMRRKR